MTAAALAVTTPPFQWYALLLVMLVALDGHPEWLAFAAAGYYASEPSMGLLTIPHKYHDAFAYGMALLVVLAGWLVRRELGRRGIVRPERVPVPVPVMADSAVAGLVAASPVTVTVAASPFTGPVAASAVAVPVAAGAGQLTAQAQGAEADPVGAFLPVGYPPGKHQTAPAL